MRFRTWLESNVLRFTDEMRGQIAAAQRHFQTSDEPYEMKYVNPYTGKTQTNLVRKGELRDMLGSEYPEDMDLEGAYKRSTGEIGLKKDLEPFGVRSTTSHELGHAIDPKIAKQTQEWPWTPRTPEEEWEKAWGLNVGDYEHKQYSYEDDPTEFDAFSTQMAEGMRNYVERSMSKSLDDWSKNREEEWALERFDAEHEYLKDGIQKTLDYLKNPKKVKDTGWIQNQEGWFYAEDSPQFSKKFRLRMWRVLTELQKNIEETQSHMMRSFGKRRRVGRRLRQRPVSQRKRFSA
jgi:hypothetical protein